MPAFHTSLTGILVIDDNGTMLDVIERSLLTQGLKVQAAANGLHGFELTMGHLPDVVITDVMMPEKEGLQTIREIRAIFPQLEIFAITGGRDLLGRDLLKIAQMPGASMGLRKPFDSTPLLNIVRELPETK